MSSSNRSSNKLCNKSTSRSLNTTSSSNFLSLASTPYSTDQNDEIWIEFLNSLNQQTPEIKSVDSNIESTSFVTNKSVDEVQVIDNDDANDPDFTVCLENFDLDDPDYMDEWFQIPKKEAVELVKDAIEICDGAPIVYDDQRHSKIKSAITIKKISSELINKPPLAKSNKSNEITEKQDEEQNENTTQVVEFIPEFDSLQRKQLDEQLRNKVLKSMNDDGDKENDDSLSHMQFFTLKNFEIINLNESLEIVSNIQKMNKEELNFDLKQGIPSKFLEIIITSPVFYNTNLVPNLSKFKYQSHFKRAQFTDTEKILLIMGFNKFKHLPKSECCECIKGHLLPNRSCDDIRKQLNYFSNSEQRQAQLKELLRKQKQLMTNLMQNYDFDKEIHYKSPFEQSENVQLPSQYTIIIERIRLAKVLKDARKSLKEQMDKNNETPAKKNETQAQNQPSTPTTILSQQIQNVEINDESILKQQKQQTEYPRSTYVQKIRPPITKVVTNKRQRSESPPTPETIKSPQIVLQTEDSIALEIEPEPLTPEKSTTTTSTIVLSPVSSVTTTPVNEDNAKKKPEPVQTPIIINQQKINSMPVMTSSLPTASSILLPSANFIDLFARPANLLNPTIIRPISQTIPVFQQLPMGSRTLMQLPQQSPPVYLPANFGGTVLIQPTIHIHTNSKSFDLAKYCQIKPKEAGKDYSNQSLINGKKKKN